MNRSKREAQWWDSAGAVNSPDGYNILEPADIRRLELVASAEGGIILDAGGGHGSWAKRFAESSRTVICGDISYNSLCDVKHPSILPCRMNVEKIPIADNSIAVIHGQDIIHHVNAALFGAECARVLAPGGVLVMWENSAANPILIFARTQFQ